MAVSERSRHALYEAARSRLGDDAAETLMELLPPVGWADVATKHDLLELERRIDLRFEGFAHRFEGFEHRFEAMESRLVAKLHQEIALVRRDVGSEIGAVRQEIGSIHLAIARQTRTILASLVGILGTAAALAFGVAQLQ